MYKDGRPQLLGHGDAGSGGARKMPMIRTMLLMQSGVKKGLERIMNLPNSARMTLRPLNVGGGTMEEDL